MLNQAFPKKERNEQPAYTTKTITHTFYNPPTDKNGNKIYVPVVMTNKQCLVWYLIGFWKSHNSMVQAFTEQTNEKIDEDDESIDDQEESSMYKLINPNGFNIFTIDSTRFNNILPNNKSEVNMNDDELDEYFEFINNKISVPDTNHKDNDLLTDVDLGFFSIDCDCGCRHTFKNPGEIPEDNFKCPYCDKLLIHYTNMEDDCFTYDNAGAY